MAQFIFDTNDPNDIQLLQKLVAAGLITPPDEHGDIDLTKAVDALLSSLGTPAKVLIAEFVNQTAVGATATLESVAEATGMTLPDAKAKKMNFGRTVKKVRRDFPGLPEPIHGRYDAKENCTVYSMDPDIRAAMDGWFERQGWGVADPTVVATHAPGEGQPA